MNTSIRTSKPSIALRRSAYLAALGALTFSAPLACSGEPATSTPVPSGTAGSATTPASTGGTGFGTGGSGFGTGGSGFGTGGTGGTGPTTAGTSATGGSGIVVATPYCNGKPLAALPFEVTGSFYPSAWQGDFAAISIPADVDDACEARVAGAVGGCSKWRYTPNATTPAWAGVSWSTVADANFTHDPVCLAANATRVTFHARGAEGGEAITVSAAGADEIPLTLTAEWKAYEVSLAGVVYNTPEIGVTAGFFWKVVPTEAATPTAFFIDNIQVMSGDSNPGGEGGAGGADSGAAGAGGAP